MYIYTYTNAGNFLECRVWHMFECMTTIGRFTDRLFFEMPVCLAGLDRMCNFMIKFDAFADSISTPNQKN